MSRSKTAHQLYLESGSSERFADWADSNLPKDFKYPNGLGAPAPTEGIQREILSHLKSATLLKEAVLDLFAQFEDPNRNGQEGDIQPQLDRLARLVDYTGPIVEK